MQTFTMLFVIVGLPIMGASQTTGPLTNDETLFQLLNLDYPGLENVSQGVKENKLELAKSRLAAYLRKRTTVLWRFDPHHVDRSVRYDKSSADQAIAGRIQVSSIWHTFPNGDIDWFYNPTIEREDLFDDYEWQWQLGRMGFWPNLGRTYWATGHEAYAQAFVKHLSSWIKQCPRPNDSGNYSGSAWRTIECGIRMGSTWPDAYHRFLHSPSFTDHDVILFLKSCLEQAQHLRKNPTSGNWLTMEMSGLYTIGALFPELKDADEWRSYAINRIYEELSKQFLPDGAQIELTPGYHQVALSNVLHIPELAKQVGRFHELPEDFVAKTEKAFDYNLYLMTPDRDMPKLNDSWHVNVPGTMRNAVELFPHRKDFLWVATNGKEGTMSEKTSYPFPYAGYYVMRSGWDEKANYLCFDAGPLGYGHVHQDKLNVVIWAYGREILFDAGGGSYERSKWRSYDIDTFSHNTVLVDGYPQRRQTRDRWACVSTEPLDVKWQSTDTYDFAVGSYNDAYG
ncbi:heparinase, partial [Candidatus Poribacteria bacterium]|nr:heparinase [Candidatus Poribacteria bacterium]